jgi:hypothetical protein
VHAEKAIFAIRDIVVASGSTLKTLRAVLEEYLQSSTPAASSPPAPVQPAQSVIQHNHTHNHLAPAIIGGQQLNIGGNVGMGSSVQIGERVGGAKAGGDVTGRDHVKDHVGGNKSTTMNWWIIAPIVLGGVVLAGCSLLKAKMDAPQVDVSAVRVIRPEMSLIGSGFGSWTSVGSALRSLLPGSWDSRGEAASSARVHAPLLGC